jgi:protein phosphatase
MGGHIGGEIASRIAVDGVADYLRKIDGDVFWPFGFESSLSIAANRLRTAICVANGKILETATLRRELSGMGTTVVAGLVDAGTLAIGHVGDSRLYLFSQGRLELLTVDDSWALNRNVLTNVLGSRGHVGVHVAERKLNGGDLIVLITDGIHTVVDDDAIAAAVKDGREPEPIADALVNGAIKRGSRDNCTAVVAVYDQ